MQLRSVIRKMLLAINLKHNINVSLTENMKVDTKYCRINTYYIVTEWLDPSDPDYKPNQQWLNAIRTTCGSAIEVINKLKEIMDRNG